MNKLPKPQIKSIFPSRETTKEAEDYLKSQLPIETHNQLTAALALYHNSMLREIQDADSQRTR